MGLVYKWSILPEVWSSINEVRRLLKYVGGVILFFHLVNVWLNEISTKNTTVTTLNQTLHCITHTFL